VDVRSQRPRLDPPAELIRPMVNLAGDASAGRAAGVDPSGTARCPPGATVLAKTEILRGLNGVETAAEQHPAAETSRLPVAGPALRLRPS
jgi:hypothetical protein